MAERSKRCQIVINIDDVESLMTALTTQNNENPQAVTRCGDVVQIPAAAFAKLKKLATSCKLKVRNLQALEIIDLIKQLK